MSSRWARPAVRRTVAVAAVTGVAALAVTGVVGPDRPAAAATLTPFGDCAALSQWSRQVLEPLVGPWGLGGGAERAMAGAAGAGAGAAGAEATVTDSSAGQLAVGPGATGTNLQEQGVDEPDTVKTSDGLLFTVVGQDLVVADVGSPVPVRLASMSVPGLQHAGAPWPGAVTDLAVTDRMMMPAVGGAELLLVDRKVVVLGAGWLPPGVPTTTVTVVDVSAPTAPTVVSTTELEGRYVSARESGGAVRLVLASSPVLAWVTPGEHLDETAATRHNRQLLADAGPGTFLPHRVHRGGSGDVVTREPLLSCAAVYHPAEPSGAGTVTVLTLDVDADDPVVDTVGVTTDGDLVYASADRLYVATTEGGWSDWLRPQSAPTPERTALHGFDITGTRSTSYLVSGEVDGWLLGRWALSAREGLLRVATTRGERWSGDPGAAPKTDSAVTVLAERGGSLEPVGHVEGLGLGEQIRAVRWFDDVAVVVTFRQTDPLYVVDLSVPAAPIVRGELKVPGYSAYLHPLGEGLLLGVGQDATAEGRTTGAQLATFDISDPTAPSRLDVVVNKDAWSDVEGDSRVFTYLPERRTALVPMNGPAGASVHAVRIGADGSLDELGRFAAAGAGRGPAWLMRAVSVGADRVAVLVQGDRGPSLHLLRLDSLSQTGSTDLG